MWAQSFIGRTLSLRISQGIKEDLWMLVPICAHATQWWVAIKTLNNQFTQVHSLEWVFCSDKHLVYFFIVHNNKNFAHRFRLYHWHIGDIFFEHKRPSQWVDFIYWEIKYSDTITVSHYEVLLKVYSVSDKLKKVLNSTVQAILKLFLIVLNI